MIDTSIRINGVNYVVVRERTFMAGNVERTVLFVRRVGGKIIRQLIRYEDGSLSSVT